MLDINFIREKSEYIIEKYRQRGLNISLDELLSYDLMRRKKIIESDELKHIRNTVSREIGFLQKRGERADEKIAYMKEISQKIKEADDEINEYEGRINNILFQLPNIPHESVPIGKDANDNKEIRRWGSPPVFNFRIRY